MAEIPEPDFGEVKPSSSAMSFAHQEGGRNETGASDEYVAIDIETLSILSANDGKDSTSSPRVSRVKTLCRKGSQRSGGGEERKGTEGETAGSSTGGPGSDVKSALLVHVAGEGEPSGFPHATTPTAAGGRCRRPGRRQQTSWLDPRRVLFFFATLSSMGTLILLYFTLSMGKVAGSDANTR